jgi:hypothetical protein
MFGFRRIMFHRTIAILFGLMVILSTYLVITMADISG